MNTEAFSDQYAGIKSARTTEELYAAVRALGTVRGPQHFFNESDVKYLVAQYHKGDLSALDRLTDTGGLRDKVKELFIQKVSDTLPRMNG